MLLKYCVLCIIILKRTLLNIIENEEILSKAEEYQKNGLKSLDSLHVACAVYAKCDVFITTDKGILKKKIDDIKVLNPIDFMREVINNDD